MRDLILLAVVVVSVPACLVSTYFGVLMWYWVTYFNPHRFAFAMYNFPIAMCVAVPTLIGAAFAKKSLRALLASESVLLIGLWAWFAYTYFHAKDIALFAGNMPDADLEINHISKILFMTLLMVVIISTKERLRGVLLVTGGSLGLLALKGLVFGVRNAGIRVFGPPDSFLADNNSFGLALNMCVPLLFFLIRDEPRKWLRVTMRILMVSSYLVVLMTYSRGDLVGLAFVTSALLFRSRRKFAGLFALTVVAFLVLALAPQAWMNRMGAFMSGDFDDSAEMRFISWQTAWQLSHDYPVTGGSFHVLENADVYQRYEPRPLPGGALSSGPHSIYFQLLSDQGFVGLGLFLVLIASCMWSLYRVRRVASRLCVPWLVNYAFAVETSILAFLISGAFLGVMYLDVIYQMIGLTIVLKFVLSREHKIHFAENLRSNSELALEEAAMPA